MYKVLTTEKFIQKYGQFTGKPQAVVSGFDGAKLLATQHKDGSVSYRELKPGRVFK